jgi:hypothetical protein
VVDVGNERLAFDVLAATGAEPDDGSWSVTGFVRDGAAVAGDSAWAGLRGSLRSPPIAVPADDDTLVVLFWSRHFGDGFDLRPHGEVRVSDDDGGTWRVVGMVAGIAPAYYPERAEIVGVAGRTIRVEFMADFVGDIPAWWLDEVMVVRPRTAPRLASEGVATVRPSENPVRGPEVRFAWPFDESGQATAYDGAGRVVWRTSVAPDAAVVTWSLLQDPVANGVYFVVLRSGGREARGKVFVLRSGG